MHVSLSVLWVFIASILISFTGVNHAQAQPKLLTAYIDQPQKSAEIKDLLKWLKNKGYKKNIRKKTMSPTVRIVTLSG